MPSRTNPENIIHSDGSDIAERLTILTSFSMFYKKRIGNDENIHHTVVFPGYTGGSYMPNNPMPHQHEHFELIYVLEGELTNIIEGTSYTYKKGDACLLNRNTRHSDIPRNDCNVVFINFNAEYFIELMHHEKAFANTNKLPVEYGSVRSFLTSNISGDDRFVRNYLEFTASLQSISGSQDNPASRLIDNLQNEMENCSLGASYLIKGILLRLLSVLEDKNLYHCNTMRLDTSNDEFIYARINNYIKEANGNISREELSSALNYNAEYLNQIVKRKTGKSLLKLAKTYRLKKAKHMLISSEDSVVNIVHQLGFAGTTHFYRFFKEETGMTPTEYREKHG